MMMVITYINNIVCVLSKDIFQNFNFGATYENVYTVIFDLPLIIKTSKEGLKKGTKNFVTHKFENIGRFNLILE